MYGYLKGKEKEKGGRETDRQTDRECEKRERERYLIILSFVSIQHYQKTSNTKLIRDKKIKEESWIKEN